jgi:hypothetical protein
MKILPCPWCHRDDKVAVLVISTYQDDIGVDEFHVVCACGAGGPFKLHDRDACVKAWNEVAAVHQGYFTEV